MDTRLDYVALEKRIENLVTALSQAEDETQGYLVRLGVILTASLVEVSCQDILGNYSAARAHDHVARFADAQLQKFTNINAEKLCTLLGAFHKEHRAALEQVIAGQIKDSIDSLVNVRNNLAHGRNVTTSRVALTQYFSDAKKIVRFLETRFRAD